MSARPLGEWLLIVVEGPSEAKEGAQGVERQGVVTKIIEDVFGKECAEKGATVRYWRYAALSPLRKQQPPRGFAARAAHFARLGKATAYGTVLLVDNDNDRKQDRLAELRRGVENAGLSDRTAVGVARQMLEAWLLADEELLATALPPGKSCEELWGAKADRSSNYPKHVLARCVLEPRNWAHGQALDHWDPGRAQTRCKSLREFYDEVRRLAGQYEGE